MYLRATKSLWQMDVVMIDVIYSLSHHWHMVPMISLNPLTFLLFLLALLCKSEFQWSAVGFLFGS